MRKKRFLILGASIFILYMLWSVLLPALVVLSFVPQFDTPPINWVSKDPQVSSLSPSFDLYQTKSRVRGNLIVFHAANEKGKDDSRLQNLAKIFARSGFDVYLPTLANLNREKFHPQVMEEMTDLIKFVQDKKPDKPLVLFSFSIGVGPELIVASRPDLKDKIDLVIAFGGYFDLEDVVAFHTTGRGQDPFGIWLFARYYAQFLPQDAKIFYEIADRKWQDPNASIADLAKNLGLDGKKALALLENKDPQAVGRLMANLPQALKNFFTVFDPKPHLANLKSEILLLHSRHDPVIPFAESEKLLAALKEENKKVSFYELRVFDHVNPILPDLTLKNFFTLYLPEFWRLYRAVSRVIY